MTSPSRTYVAIDLKSFYASVECVDKGLDPLKAHLVVADPSRTEKTICLAVSPALKALGIPGRPRLFEVVQRVEAINRERARRLRRPLSGPPATDADDLAARPDAPLGYIVATPRMARYIEVSTQIYGVYLKYVAAQDIHVYSIDEVFMDVTGYLHSLKLDAEGMARRMVQDVLKETGITATAGIGTNLYLCKVAMDILAKHAPPDENGVRIAALDETGYRRQLWTHRPLTDFWRIGPGIARRLEEKRLFTMGDVARCSLGKPSDFYNEDLLYKMFGVNAQLLIDHAWGVEPCTIAAIKAYRPASSSLSQGQVLHCPYEGDKARLVVMEMTDLLVLDLVSKGLVTDQIALMVDYDGSNLSDPERRRRYSGPVVMDHYGREVPKPAHGSANLPEACSSTRIILDAMKALYDRIVDPSLLVRRIHVVASHTMPESEAAGRLPKERRQMDLFADHQARKAEEEAHRQDLAREKRVQQALLDIKKRFGKNAILKGMNLEEGATTMDRNGQIGGHKA